MNESDKLLAKADALLARGRSPAVAPRPPADYPVLTEVVKAPTAQAHTPRQEVPSGVQAPLSEPPVGAAAEKIPVPDSPLPSPTAALPVLDAAEASQPVKNAAGKFLIATSTDAAQPPADTAMQALEERVYLRVLGTVEPYVGAFIEDPLILRIEELARKLAAGIALDARDEILTLVRDAVRSAVARELEPRPDE